MGRKRFDHMNCGVAQALEQIGDWWTLLIVRDAFFGARRFGEFEKSLGVAKNILTDRLAKLVANEIFEKVDGRSTGSRRRARRCSRCSPRMREWSDEWVFGRGAEPVIVKDRRTGRRIPRMRVTDADGNELARRDLRTVPGPGASAETQRLLTRRS